MGCSPCGSGVEGEFAVLIVFGEVKGREPLKEETGEEEVEAVLEEVEREGGKTSVAEEVREGFFGLEDSLEFEERS